MVKMYEIFFEFMHKFFYRENVWMKINTRKTKFYFNKRQKGLILILKISDIYV